MRQPIYIIEDFYGNILFSEERSGVVSVAAVGEESNNGLALCLGTLSDLDSCVEGSTGRDTYKDTFLLGKELCGSKCVLVGDRHYLVIYGGIKSVGNEAGADTLDLVRACFALGKNGRVGRLDSCNLNVGVLGLKELAYACNGSACTNACVK